MAHYDAEVRWGGDHHIAESPLAGKKLKRGLIVQSVLSEIGFIVIFRLSSVVPSSQKHKHSVIPVLSRQAVVGHGRPTPSAHGRACSVSGETRQEARSAEPRAISAGYEPRKAWMCL